MATKKDFTQVAYAVFQQAVGEAKAIAPNERQESGRKGGLKGGASRAIKLTPEKRREIALKAAATRWKKKAPSEV